MSYLILVLFVFSLLMVIFNYKNQHTWYLFLLNIAFIIFIFSFLLLIGKSGSYINSGNKFFWLDYNLFLRIIKLRISYYDIIRLLNSGISLYIFSLVLFTLRYTHSDNCRFTKTVYGKILYLMILLFPFWYFIYYNPSVGRWLHILFYSESTKNLFFTNAVFRTLKILDFVSNALLYLYLIAVPAGLFAFALKSRIRRIKIQHLTISFFILCINIVFLSVILSEQIRTIHNYTKFDSTLFFNTSLSIVKAPKYEALCLFCIVFSQLSFWILIKYSTYNILPFFTRMRFKKSKLELANNSKELLHSFKNTIFSVQVLCKQADILTEPKDIQNLFSRIDKLCEASLESITSTLNSFGEITISYHRCDITETLDKIITMLNIPLGITVRRSYDFNGSVLLSPYHFEQAIINILANAVESITEKGEDNGKIEISTFTEDKWIAIYIKDNGIGIKRRDYKKIFKPFSSGKQLSTNWGLGLYYTKRIVEAHQGHIFVESKRKVYTTFQILLPL